MTRHCALAKPDSVSKGVISLPICTQRSLKAGGLALSAGASIAEGHHLRSAPPSSQREPPLRHPRTLPGVLGHEVPGHAEVLRSPAMPTTSPKRPPCSSPQVPVESKQVYELDAWSHAMPDLTLRRDSTGSALAKDPVHFE